jgi:hypothetical protein
MRTIQQINTEIETILEKHGGKLKPDGKGLFEAITEVSDARDRKRLMELGLERDQVTAGRRPSNAVS